VLAPLAPHTPAIAPVRHDPLCPPNARVNQLVHPGTSYADFFARTFAQRARCAAAILLRPAAEIVRFLRVGLLPCR